MNNFLKKIKKLNIINIICIIIIIILFFYLLTLYNNYLFILDKYENFNEMNNKGIYTACIIEPRQHKAMEFVLENFTSMLDERWNFIIFHGNKNVNFILNILDSSKILKDNIVLIFIFFLKLE